MGGQPGAADKAAELLARQNPNLEIVGTCCPPFGFERDQPYARSLSERIRAARPDILFVAFGAPKQEYWMQENAHRSCDAKCQ